jgi:hypothetical protein
LQFNTDILPAREVFKLDNVSTFVVTTKMYRARSNRGPSGGMPGSKSLSRDNGYQFRFADSVRKYTRSIVQKGSSSTSTTVKPFTLATHKRSPQNMQVNRLHPVKANEPTKFMPNNRPCQTQCPPTRTHEAKLERACSTFLYPPTAKPSNKYLGIIQIFEKPIYRATASQSRNSPKFQD